MEYKLEVQDWARRESRLEWIGRLEKFLKELSEEGIIGSYSLATPYGSTTIFKGEAKA